jgi:hypothetical protein
MITNHANIHPSLRVVHGTVYLATVVKLGNVVTFASKHLYQFPRVIRTITLYQNQAERMTAV